MQFQELSGTSKLTVINHFEQHTNKAQYFHFDSMSFHFSAFKLMSICLLPPSQLFILWKSFSTTCKSVPIFILTSIDVLWCIGNFSFCGYDLCIWIEWVYVSLSEFMEKCEVFLLKSCCIPKNRWKFLLLKFFKMPFCVIEGCKSKKSDKDRHFFGYN